MRQAIGMGLGWLGLALDPARNAAYRAGERARCEIGSGLWVIPTDEEAQIAALTRAVLG